MISESLTRLLGPSTARTGMELVSSIVIRADFDDEAHVGVAQSDDIPLVTEAETISGLFNKLPNIIHDVLETNGVSRAGAIVTYEVITRSRVEPKTHAS